MKGIQLLGDLNECRCDEALLRSRDNVEQLLVDECRAAGLTVVGSEFHQFGTPDAPAGVTGVVLLEESHACVHTWPERRCVTLDVYVCSITRDNSKAARTLFDRLLSVFAPQRAETSAVERGVGK
jgi:S-adenosylmethionine decarboxylase proenzyme